MKKVQKQKDDKENDQKAKEREEKKKKKEADKQRQEFLLETRKAQAAARWASTDSPRNGNHHAEAEVTILTEVDPILTAEFTPVPLRNRNSAATTASPASNTTPVPCPISSSVKKNQIPVVPQQNSDRVAVYLQQCESVEETCIDHCLDDQDEALADVISPHTSQQTLQRTSSNLTSTKNKSTSLPHNTHCATVCNSATSPVASTESPQPLHSKSTYSRQGETPRRLPNKEKSNCDPRRGLHFQSSLVESSSEDEDTSDHCLQEKPDLPQSRCCRVQRFENEALRKRLQKLHKRLNIACK